MVLQNLFFILNSSAMIDRNGLKQLMKVTEPGKKVMNE